MFSTPNLASIQTRASSLFVPHGPITVLPSLTHYVSVHLHVFGSLSIHSSALIHVAKVDSVPSLLEALRD